MTATFEVINPDDVKLTLHITMPLSEWKQLKLQQDHNKWPASSFASYIMDMIDQADKHFYPKTHDK